MLQVFEDLTDLNTAAANLFIQAANEAIAERGRFTVALTGGSSPKGLYQLLASSPYKEQIDWQKVFVFWGDERWVPLTDERSNAKMTAETLLNRVPIPNEHIFVMWKEHVEPRAYAETYGQLIEQQVKDSRFDLILLGMGDDGHTASLFPGTPVLYEKDKNVAAYFLMAQDMYRITLTAPLINRARKVAFLLFGEKKAPALKEVLEGQKHIEKYPSQLIQPIDGELFWFVDTAAAQLLND